MTGMLPRMLLDPLLETLEMIAAASAISYALGLPLGLLLVATSRGGRAMGGSRWTIVREVLVPEALPGLVAGFSVTIVTLIGASAMAGAIGAGGLGDLAIRYGYQRFETGVMLAVVAVLILLVASIQFVGDHLVCRLDHR